MSIADRLGKNGIFISDSARDQLNIKLTDEEFQKLKSEVNSKDDPNEVKKCFINNTYVKMKDGLFLDPEWVASAIEKNIESQEKLFEQYRKENVVICDKCGTKNIAEHRHFKCKECFKEIDSKKYKKSIKMPYTKKMAMKLYVKYLRGKVL